MRRTAAVVFGWCLAGASVLGGQSNQWSRTDQPPEGAVGSAWDPVDKCVYLLARERWNLPWKFAALKSGGERVELAVDPLLDTVRDACLVFDPVNREPLLVGAGVLPGDLGWTVVLAYGPGKKQWRRLAFGDEATRKAHAARLAARDAVRELVGRTRACWYRDNGGQGTEAERKDLADRCAALGRRPELAEFKADVERVAGPVGQKKLLEALTAARELARRFEDAVEAAAPVPPARMRSPPAVDRANRALVLFGGDREDCLTNDTWLLDLVGRGWRRASPKAAPGPRAGHSLAYLPKAKLIAMWDGYVQTNDPGYRSPQARPVDDRGLWLFDAARSEWKLLPAAGSAPPWPGFVDDYGRYVHTDLRADGADVLVVTVRGGKEKPGDAFWTMPVEAGAAADPGRLGASPNTRAGRSGPFLASGCEGPEPGRPVDPAAVPANVWTRLSAAPRSPFCGQRLKDWGTAAWDPDRGQILYWGGGHCVGAYSVVTHWSPASGRFAEGYDTDEQYGHQGSGASSLLGRPFVPTHAYRSYAYDPRLRRLVTAKEDTVFLYDPLRMDWSERIGTRPPFVVHCYTMVLTSTPHGVVCWAGRPGEYMGGARGLWLLQDAGAWKELVKPGGMPGSAYGIADGSSACYDSGRDRLLVLLRTKEPGLALTAYSFKTGAVERLAGAALPQVGLRESAYAEDCGWVVVGQRVGDGQSSPVRYPVYDCAANRWMLAELGDGPDWNAGGMVYDPARRLCYLVERGGALWALRLDPKTAKVVEAEGAKTGQK